MFRETGNILSKMRTTFDNSATVVFREINCRRSWDKMTTFPLSCYNIILCNLSVQQNDFTAVIWSKMVKSHLFATITLIIIRSCLYM